MSIVKKTNYHHTLQAFPSGIWTHIWQNKLLRKILIIDPGYTTPAQLSMLVDWQGYEVHIAISEMKLETCGRVTQLKQALHAHLHVHQKQLMAMQTVRNQAVAAQACEVFLPHADYIYTEEKGRLTGWTDWSFVWQEGQMNLAYVDEHT